MKDWPVGKYDVVLADPPWHHFGSKVKDAAAGKHYSLLGDSVVRGLPVKDLLSDRGVVFLWATCPRLDFAVSVLSDWGLFFRGVAFVWVKCRKDGVPVGAQGVRPTFVKPLTELVLVASVKRPPGRVLPLMSESVCQTVFAPRGRHSAKPGVVRERIVDLLGDVPRLELFARERVDGWDCWGNEV